MRRLNAAFYAFADRAKHLVSSPIHFTLTLVTFVVWGLWAHSRGFDPFSQLVLNTPTTALEYVFEILILASAIAAESKAADILVELVRIVELLRADMRQLRDDIRADFAQLLAEEQQTDTLVDRVLERLDEHWT
jgi:low affinity Fe/Cu permease